MSRWSHSKKQVRDALDHADIGGFGVEPKSGRSGHAWGGIRCQVCRQRFTVFSTPRSADNHANQIHRFIARHSHAEEDDK
jgi:hypothetical protein